MRSVMRSARKMRGRCAQQRCARHSVPNMPQPFRQPRCLPRMNRCFFSTIVCFAMTGYIWPADMRQCMKAIQPAFPVIKRHAFGAGLPSRRLRFIADALSAAAAYVRFTRHKQPIDPSEVKRLRYGWQPMPGSRRRECAAYGENSKTVQDRKRW